MQKIDATQIKDVVRQSYGQLARQAAAIPGACCEPAPSHLYCGDETEGLPGGALAASAGCGNPHAIGTLGEGETVVDFGSGGGIDCFIAARVVGPLGRVIGVDMTADMIDLARRGASEAGLENVEFHLAEMEATPLVDASVDAIITNCVINLAPDKDRVFAEAFRILRPGGRLMISDLVRTGEVAGDANESLDDWVCCLAGTELREVYLSRIRTAGFEPVDVVAAEPWRSERWHGALESASIIAHKPA